MKKLLMTTAALFALSIAAPAFAEDAEGEGAKKESKKSTKKGGKKGAKKAAPKDE